MDYDSIRSLTKTHKPKAIMCGASAYSRTIDFAALAEIAHSAGAYLIADISHIAGLVATGNHPSPFGHADIVTTTTHKTLRSARGGLIFAKKELMKKVDFSIFPYSQGGPLQNVIAAKAVSANECMSPAYYKYIKNVVDNANAMCWKFIVLGYSIVSGGTDNHLFIIDLAKTFNDERINGKAVQDLLDVNGITLNKNCIPGEKLSPTLASGVRIGTPAMTTKGWNEEDFEDCAEAIDYIIRERFGK